MALDIVELEMTLQERLAAIRAKWEKRPMTPNSDDIWALFDALDAKEAELRSFRAGWGIVEAHEARESVEVEYKWLREAVETALKYIGAGIQYKAVKVLKAAIAPREGR